jgi:hypothetical protein
LEARYIKNSRSGNVGTVQVRMAIKIPDREISLAQSPVMADNFPNGKLIKP